MVEITYDSLLLQWADYLGIEAVNWIFIFTNIAILGIVNIAESYTRGLRLRDEVIDPVVNGFAVSFFLCYGLIV